MKNNETAIVNDEAGKVEEVAETPEQVEEVKDEMAEPAPATPEKKPGAKAKVKEFFRKKVVGLKRKPQNIAFFVLIVTSLFYLLSLNTVSPGPVDFFDTYWLGLCVFVTTLFSILVLVLYLNIFPKHPKVNKKTGKKRNINYAMLVLTFVFIAVMITMNILYYVILVGEIAGHESMFFRSVSQANRYKQYWSAGWTPQDLQGLGGDYKSYLLKSFDICIAHTVMLGISALLLATLPLYKKLIMKINTSKEIASTEIKEAIDVED